MLKAHKEALFSIIIALFIITVIKPALAEEEFDYRSPKLKPQTANSTLFLTPIRKLDPSSFMLDLVVDPAGEEINTVSAEISFPPDMISLLEMSKENSFCSFFIEEQIDNGAGKIKISCSKPYPGTDQLSNVASFKFKIIGTGSAQLSLGGDSLVLANDGYGTNVLKHLDGQIISLEK